VNGRWLLRLYPSAWRERYGEEYLALLEQLPASPRVVADALLGAADAHLHPRIVPAARPMPEAPVVVPPEPPPSSIPPRRTILRDEFESAIDQIVREAAERGLFDNLEGAGKPLRLEDDAAAGDWAMAFRMLKNAGETLPWITLGHEITEGQQRLGAQLADAGTRLRGLRSDRVAYKRERERLRERYLAAAAELDRKLIEYGAMIPSYTLDRGRLPAAVAAGRFDQACPLQP
jgi:DnaJ family protein C protein 28